MYSFDDPFVTRPSNDDDLECPTCSKPLVMGLPNDATVEAVSRRPVGNRGHSPRTKTREVACRSGHEVYVTFSVAARGGRITE